MSDERRDESNDALRERAEAGEESTPSQESEPASGKETSPISREHLLFGGVGLMLGVLAGYTLAFQIHRGGRPGFEPPAPPNAAAMAPGQGVQAGGGMMGAAAGRPDFINPDGSIDMDKVPPDVRDQMQQAKDLLEQHEKMLDEDPDNVDLMTTIGRFYMNFGMGDKALSYYERAVETEPERADLHQELGLAFYDLGRYGEAIQTLGRAHEMAPGDADILTHIALAQLRMQRVDEALATLDRAAAIDPENVMSRYNRAVILLFAKQDPDAAQEALEEAGRLLPEGDSRMEVMQRAIDRYRETGQLPHLPMGG